MKYVENRQGNILKIVNLLVLLKITYMKITLLFILSLVTLFSFSQEDTVEFSVPRFTKQAIGNSGCFAYVPSSETLAVIEEFSQDSSVVYTAEIQNGEYLFAIIVVKLNGTELTTDEEKDEMMVSYLDFLQESFMIIDAVGYGYGHTMTDKPDVRGIIDFWVDEDGDQWAVKSWSNNNTLAVMLEFGPNEYPSYSALQLFLDGFRFE